MTEHTQEEIAFFKAGQVVRFHYTNWRGEIAVRQAEVIRLLYGSSEWHPDPQWIVEGLDLEKGAVRFFALADMKPILQNSQ